MSSFFYPLISIILDKLHCLIVQELCHPKKVLLSHLHSDFKNQIRYVFLLCKHQFKTSFRIWIIILSDWPVFWYTAFSPNILNKHCEHSKYCEINIVNIRNRLKVIKIVGLLWRSFPFSSSWHLRVLNLTVEFVVIIYAKVFGKQKKAECYRVAMKWKYLRCVCNKDMFDRWEWEKTNCWASATWTNLIHKIFVRSWGDCYSNLNQYSLT